MPRIRGRAVEQRGGDEEEVEAESGTVGETREPRREGISAQFSNMQYKIQLTLYIVRLQRLLLQYKIDAMSLITSHAYMHIHQFLN